MEKNKNTVAFVKKRDGNVVPFEKKKIAHAIFQAIKSVGTEDRLLADELAESVALYLGKQYQGSIPDIETIQDTVERILMEMGQIETAKSYILYREKRAQLRKLMNKAHEDTVSLEKGWNRKKIITALMSDLGLPFILAEKIVDVVEENIGERSVPPEQLNLSIN
ncbi:MAG: ATP cone domain-containing protein [Candidatus Ancaeobacter aquaticus]|nr:ATP cone domain-containing protein [Candidatus Ancaeobacter aquaticus]